MLITIKFKCVMQLKFSKIIPMKNSNRGGGGGGTPALDLPLNDEAKTMRF